MEKCTCKILGLFGFISKKRVLLILRGLSDGAVSFTDIKKYLGGVNSKIISERLTQLQEKGFIAREVIDEKPIKIRYVLTEKGISLSQELEHIDHWVKKREK